MTRWILLAAGWLLIGASLPMTLDAGWFGKLPGWAVFLSPFLLPANLCLLCSPALVAVRRRGAGRWIARLVALLMLEPGALMVHSLVADGTTDLPPAIILYTVGQLVACIAVWLPLGARKPTTAPGGFPVIASGRTGPDGSSDPFLRRGAPLPLAQRRETSRGLVESPKGGAIATSNGSSCEGAESGSPPVLDYSGGHQRAVTPGRLAGAGVLLTGLSIGCSVLVGGILATDRGLGLAFHLPLLTKDGTAEVFAVAAISLGVGGLSMILLAGTRHALRWRWTCLAAIGDLLSVAGAALWLQSNGWFG
jgi:hypothetical protein